LESNGNGRASRIEEKVDIIAHALTRVIIKELKAQGLSAIVGEDPMELLQRYAAFEEAIPPKEQPKGQEKKEDEKPRK
jgi:hypothetical protein